MKFGSSSALFKYLFINGTVLTLLCVSTVVEAAIYTVNNALDDGSVGSLRWAITSANAGPGNGVAFDGFSIGLNSNINVGASFPNLLYDMTLDTIGTAFYNISINKGGNFTTINNGVTLTLLNYNNVWHGNFVNNGILVLDTNNIVTSFPSTISGTGNVIVNGTGGLTGELFAQAHSYLGTTSIMGTATLNLNINDALPTGTSLSMIPGTTLRLVGGNSQTLAELSGSGGTITLDAGNILTVGDDINDTTFAGVIVGGAGNVTKVGTKTLTLTGVNTYGGTTTINNGSIKIPTAASLASPVSIASGVGTSTLEMNGGTLAGIITGAPNSTLLITGVFTPAAAITNVRTVDVASTGNFTLMPGFVPTGFTNFTISGTLNMNGNNIVGGPGPGSNVNINSTLTTNGDITGSTVNVNPTGNLVLVNNITSDIVNSGTITHTANATRTIGNYTQQPGGALDINITSLNPVNYSRLNVTSATINGGNVNVNLPNGIDSIQKNDVYPILTSAAPINALPTVIVPGDFLFFNFNPSFGPGNTLQLTVGTNSFANVNKISALDGIAKELDSVGTTTNPNLNALLNILEKQTSLSTFEAYLAQLAPVGLNNSVWAPTFLGYNAAQDKIFQRLDAMHTVGVDSNIMRSGYSAGDMLENQGSYGPLFFGNSIKQSSRGGLPGYNAFTGGFGLAGDIPILEYFRVGLAASYGSTAVKQDDGSGSNTRIGSTQGMAYGSATYESLFFDGILSIGLNNYHGRRNITFLGQSASSAYTGTQYGVKVKAGFSVPCYQLEITPMGTLQYMHLNTSKYTEQGAPGLNLSVSSGNTSTTRAGLGVRIADVSQEEEFFPEIHALYLVDVKSPNLQITSRFVDGGGSFVSNGVIPPKSGFNIGASITALVSDNVMVSGGYDLEAKTSFKSHSASLKFKYLF